MRTERGGDVGAGELLEGRAVMVEDGAEGERIALSPALAEPPVEAFATELLVLKRCRSGVRSGGRRARVEPLPRRPCLRFAAPAVAELAFIAEHDGGPVDPVVVEGRRGLVLIGEIL